MSGSKKTEKLTVMSSEEMQAARQRGESKSDWARVRQEMAADPVAKEQNRQIGELVARKRGRPAGSVQEQTKTAISLRLDDDVLAVLRATGAGWQSRVNQILRERFAL